MSAHELHPCTSGISSRLQPSPTSLSTRAPGCPAAVVGPLRPASLAPAWESRSPSESGVAPTIRPAQVLREERSRRTFNLLCGRSLARGGGALSGHPARAWCTSSRPTHVGRGAMKQDRWSSGSLAFTLPATALGSPWPSRTLHRMARYRIRVEQPLPRVRSSLLDEPGLRQNRLHRRRSTRPRDLSPSLTMRCRPRGHPRCRQLRSVLPTSRPSFQRSPLHRVQAEESTPVPTSPWSLRSAAASRARVPPSWFLTTLAACSSSTLSEFSSEFQSWGS
jgi:hypothetical protein